MISDDTTQQAAQLDRDALTAFVERKWNDEIVPALTDYIAIPAKSPMFDADWVQHGYHRTRRDRRRAMGRTATRAGLKARDRAPRRAARR